MLKYLSKPLKEQKGFTLMELVLALAVIGVATIGIIVFYNTSIKPGLWMQEKQNAFSNLMGAIEQARSLNAGKYPSTTAINLHDLGNAAYAGNNAATLLRSLIGPSNPQYLNWTYACSGTTMTIVVDVSEGVQGTDKTRAEAVRSAINSNFQGNTFSCGAVAANNTFTCTRTSLVCG